MSENYQFSAVKKEASAEKVRNFFGVTFWSMKLTALELFRFVGLKNAKLQKIVGFLRVSGWF